MPVMPSFSTILLFIVLACITAVGCFFAIRFLTRKGRNKGLNTNHVPGDKQGGKEEKVEANAIIFDEATLSFDPDGEKLEKKDIPKGSFLKDWGTRKLHILGRAVDGTLWVITPPATESGHLPTDAYLLSRSKGPVKTLFNFSSPVAKALALAFFIVVCAGSLILIFMLVGSHMGQVPQA